MSGTNAVAIVPCNVRRSNSLLLSYALSGTDVVASSYRAMQCAVLTQGVPLPVQEAFRAYADPKVTSARLLRPVSY
eukprot:1464994-Rhodomonas_salina.2